MPKYAVHTIVMEKAAQKLAQSQPETANLLLEHRDIAVVGAIGPDVFFWAPDFTVCEALISVLHGWDALVRWYNESIISDIVEAIETIKNAVDDVMTSLIGEAYTLIKSLLGELKETAELFMQNVKFGALALALGVDDLIADIFDVPSCANRIYNYLRPPLQDGKSEKDWYWFDMLHYRYVGDFAGNLLSNAQTPKQKAYAHAYQTHIATDLIGHGYVNQIVGGPYRTHVQRHVVMESFLDTWALHNYRGKDISLDLVDYLGFPESLPGEVVDSLYNAFRDTYANKAHPTLLGGDGFFSKGQISDTYMAFARMTKKLENRIEMPKEPFSGVMQILEEALRDIAIPPPSPPAPRGGGDCSPLDFLSFGLTAKSRDCYGQFAEAVAEYLRYIGEMLLWTFETVRQIFQFLLALGTAVPVLYLLALLYAMQLLLYGIVMQLRDVVSLSGITYPSVPMLFTGHGRNLLIPCYCNTSDNFPHTRFTGSCLQCPDSRIELPQTAPSWYRADIEGDSADESQVRELMRTVIGGFIEDKPLRLQALSAYANAASPEATRSLYAREISNELGSAVELATWVIANQDDPVALTNWNLDSDRGYAYKQWKGTLPSENVADETYDIG